jgi:serine/threonine protein kinase
MIVVRCPSCGSNLAARASKPDGTVDCPRCGETMTLTAPASKAETLDASPVDVGRTLTLGGERPGGTDAPVQLPGYEILGEVGRGGMGVVYKAKQHHPPRLVALKMILAGEHADPDQLTRFRTEAEAIARLNHPAIVQIHHVGEWQMPGGGEPVPFLTLEFVEGTTLTQRLESGRRVTYKQAADLLQQLARGVHYAHQQGIVHRDLKPGNILLTGEEDVGSLGEAKIVDFGLAKPLDGFATIEAGGSRTRSGAVLGTPNYMAPEQARGVRDIGPPADVYSLGAVLYELITGQPPFQGESTVETLLRVTQGDPRAPRGIDSKIPRDLETICLTCLAKDPKRRYASAEELAKDLGRFLDGEPVLVRPPSAWERLGRWSRRRREVVYLGTGALVAAAAVAGIILSRPASERDVPQSGQKQDPPPNAGIPAEDTPIAEARRRMSSSNNLKQLAIGLHSLHDTIGEFPPAAICDKTGKPLLSWRVAVLPYIEQDPLYRRFKLDEPWDSPSNKALIGSMPVQFDGDVSSDPPNTTRYQAVVGPGTAWEIKPTLGGMFGRKGRLIQEITDGTSNTILVVEAADPVIWTKPDDLKFDGVNVPRFGGVVKGGFNVALADGSVRFISQRTTPTALRAALTRAGGEVVDLEEQDPPNLGGGAKGATSKGMTPTTRKN